MFFNDPVPAPDHDLQVASLALAMRERIGELAGGWRRRGYELGLGAGIAVGHATLGRIGFEGRYDEAAAGQIILSQRVYAALEGRVEASPVANLQMKGFERPVQAFELLRVVDLP